MGGLRGRSVSFLRFRVIELMVILLSIVVPDVYGLSYSIGDDYIRWTITSLKRRTSITFPRLLPRRGRCWIVRRSEWPKKRSFRHAIGSGMNMVHRDWAYGLDIT